MAQDAIRAWARDNNIPVGAKGRLPQAVVAAYLKTVGQEKPESSPSAQQAEPDASASINTFEPLADYLEPRFGNIYDWDNGIVPYVSEGGRHMQPWTEELIAAVTEYLLREISEDDYSTFLDGYASGNGPSDRQAEKMAWIMDYNQPWEVAGAFHRIAVKQAPTLDAVLKQRSPDVEIEDLKLDASLWLLAHATYEQVVEVARHRRLGGKLPTHEAAYLLPGSEYVFFALADVVFVLTKELLLDELLDAWSYVVGPAPTDLTDEEWALLQPLMPQGGSALRKRAVPQRQAINGMLYHYAHRGKRRPLPSRYGSGEALSVRRIYYRRNGVFARMLAALEGKPEAARITAWLRSELHLRETVQEQR